MRNHFEFQEIDSRNREASKESPSVFGVQGQRDRNVDLSQESLTEPEKEDFNNAPRRSNITSFTFSEPLSIKTHIVTQGWSSNASVCNEESVDFLTVEGCSSNANVCNEECADLPISAHSEVIPTE